MRDEKFTINYFWQQAHKKYADSICVQIKEPDNYKKFTYSDIEHNALRIAGFLLSQNLKPFNRVIIILENCPEWIFIYLGILKAGLTAVPLDPQLSVQEIKN
ncbi:MAG: long-chain fatty acid--CoA ligase, partial [Candidatus Omnitrophica bacterium]|nr:long-chain fatty acid--CoA ligase [Candidatus Omnitrophota bacterium]MCM8771141.1 long-chain fatty acid--CoA ligase [Candidatus Omnitrophota bacterium]